MSVKSNIGVVTDGLVFYVDAANDLSYPGSGGTWSDLVGGNDGTLTNGPTYDSANGGSIVFDGVNDHVEILNQIQFDRLDPFTFNVWLKSVNANNNQIINNEDGGYKGYSLSISTNGSIFFSVRHQVSINYAAILTNSQVPANTWINITATYDGSSNANGLKVYFNAILQSSTIQGNNLTSSTISSVTTYIGYRRPSTQGPFNGNIPNVSIYNRALSASEVLQNYNALKNRFI